MAGFADVGRQTLILAFSITFDGIIEFSFTFTYWIGCSIYGKFLAFGRWTDGRGSGPMWTGWLFGILNNRIRRWIGGTICDGGKIIVVGYQRAKKIFSSTTIRLLSFKVVEVVLSSSFWPTGKFINGQCIAFGIGNLNNFRLDQWHWFWFGTLKSNRWRRSHIAGIADISGRVGWADVSVFYSWVSSSLLIMPMMSSTVGATSAAVMVAESSSKRSNISASAADG